MTQHIVTTALETPHSIKRKPKGFNRVGSTELVQQIRTLEDLCKALHRERQMPNDRAQRRDASLQLYSLRRRLKSMKHLNQCMYIIREYRRGGWGKHGLGSTDRHCFGLEDGGPALQRNAVHECFQDIYSDKLDHIPLAELSASCMDECSLPSWIWQSWPEDAVVPISIGELRYALSNMSAGRTSATDGLVVAMVQSLPEKCLQNIADTISTILTNHGNDPCHIKQAWCNIMVILLPKVMHCTSVQQFRPIALVPALWKVIDKIMSLRLCERLQASWPQYVMGFHAGY